MRQRGQQACKVYNLLHEGACSLIRVRDLAITTSDNLRRQCLLLGEQQIGALCAHSCMIGRKRG
jgi:hypothetical protein